MNSHKSLENSVHAGIPAAQWSANSIADKLAGKAAAEAALSPIVIAKRQLRNTMTHRILSRLVCIASFVSPTASVNARASTTFCSKDEAGKVDKLEALARGSGHSLTYALMRVTDFSVPQLCLFRRHFDNALHCDFRG